MNVEAGVMRMSEWESEKEQRVLVIAVFSSSNIIYGAAHFLRYIFPFPTFSSFFTFCKFQNLFLCIWFFRIYCRLFAHIFYVYLLAIRPSMILKSSNRLFVSFSRFLAGMMSCHHNNYSNLDFILFCYHLLVTISFFCIVLAQHSFSSCCFFFFRKRMFFLFAIPLRKKSHTKTIRRKICKHKGIRYIIFVWKRLISDCFTLSSTSYR